MVVMILIPVFALSIQPLAKWCHVCKNSRNIGGLPGICKVYCRMAAAHRHGGDGAWHALDGTDGYCACSAGTGSLVVRLHLYGGEDDGRRKVWMESDSQA